MFLKSIRYKIVLIILSTSMLTMLLAFVSETIFIINNIKSNAISSITLNAKLVSEECIMPLEFGYPKRAYEVLQKLNIVPDIIFAVVYDINNNEFARYEKESIENIVIDTLNNIWFDKDILYFTNDILYDEQVLGKILMATDTRISKQIRESLTMSAIFFMAILVLGLFLAASFQRIISKPILKLANIADEISRKEDFSLRVHHAVKDEIGLLYSKFNFMLSVIENSEHERDLALEKVQANQEQLKAIINNSGTIIYLINNKNELIIVNSAFLNFFDVKFELVIHKTELEVLPGSFANEASKHDKYILRSKEPIQYEILINLKEKNHAFLINRFPIFDYLGNIQSICCIATDITQIKNTQFELEQYRNHLEDLVKIRTAEVVKINQKLSLANENLLGINEELEIKNSEINEKSEALKKANETLEKQKADLQDTLSKLNQAQAQLIQAEKMASLGVLTAGIAHEINNPINFISSGIEGLNLLFSEISELIETVLKMEPTNQEQLVKEILSLKDQNDYAELLTGIVKLTENIKIGVERTTEIIKGLKTFARSNDAKMSHANLHELIDSTLIILKNQYKSHIQITKQYSEISEILCYPGKLNQVFMNLLVNAIQSIETEGEIIIGTKQVKNNIEIKIKDNGVGIENEKLSRIFEPFYTTKTVGKGTGLGLSITFAIIEQHNGIIEVSSKPNKGTEFRITFPVT